MADATAKLKGYVEKAEKGASDTAGSATAAEGSAGDASASAGESAKSATEASTSAGEAKKSASAAAGSASSASTSADEASTSADEAKKSAQEAKSAAGKAASDVLAATKANADAAARSATEADTAASKAGEAATTATAAAQKASDIEAKLGGNILKDKVKDTLIHVDDAFPSNLLGIEIEGACKQDGTPSPDNPVPIQVIENPVLNVVGRNLLKIKDSSSTARGVTLRSKDGVITLSGTASDTGYGGIITSVHIPSGVMGQKLTVKIHTISGTVPKVCLLNGKYQLLLSSALPPVILNQQIVYLTVGVEKGMNYDCKFYITVEVYEDADTSEYSPYVETATVFTLPAEHPYLAKLPDGTADEIVADAEGNVELVARVSKVLPSE